MLLVQSTSTPPMSPVPIQRLWIPAVLPLSSHHSLYMDRDVKTLWPLLNLHGNKSCFSDSKNEQDLKGLERLIIWSQRAFLACLFIASRSKTNTIFFAFLLFLIHFSPNEMNSHLVILILHSLQRKMQTDPAPPAPSWKCCPISQQKSFLLPLLGQRH